jgi:N-acetylneuraminic acid mutarotase
MNIGRRRHAMAAVGDSLYVLGGINDENEELEVKYLNSIEQLVCGSWSEVGELLIAVHTTSVAVNAGNILVFGGCSKGDTDTAAVQCFNTLDRTISRICDLPSPQNNTRSIVHCNKVSTVTMDGVIHELCQEESKPTTCTEIAQIIDGSFRRHGYGLTKDSDQSLIILGGTTNGEDDTEQVSKDMLWINPATGELKHRQHMPFPVTQCRCCRLSIPKKFLED